MSRIDLEKRKTVMQRSIRLGHCICNPKQGCPCDTFKERDICPCAGERPEQAVEDVRLTTLVEKAGCASKINQNDLKKVLSGLPEISDPKVLVGTNTCDDAGVYQLDATTALVQTVDVFTPVVDDPYTFGQIAAANSLSDIYAMGGKPLTALTVIGFPIETVGHRVMTEMLRGGMEKMKEAGVAILGGHSINDKDPKFGYAVTGVISPSKIIANSGARPGDVLILTKPLGVGVISFAAQLGRASESAISAATVSMAELNKTAAETMAEVGVHAATDVTGFGLLGHLSEMVQQSGVTVEIYADRVPVFGEVLDYVYQGIISGGIERNREYASQRVTAGEGVSEEMLHVLYDPQTSGGLLISVREDKADLLLDLLHGRGVEHAVAIGKATMPSVGGIFVLNPSGASLSIAPPPREVPAVSQDTTPSCCTPAPEPSCCSPVAEASCCSPGPVESSASAPGDSRRKFFDFMREVTSDGAVPGRTKELMAIALSLLSKCEPCVKIHLEKARSIGVSEEEINEAVWMAISFGGAPIMMFYESVVGT